MRAAPPPVPPPLNETGCKAARLHNTCIYSVASHSWCLPVSPKPDSPKLGFRVRVGVSANRVSANRD